MLHLSIFAIFGAGLLTFASPCVLPLVPVYLSVLGGSVTVQPTRRPIAAALAFAAGLSSVFVVLGAAASALGALLVEHRNALLLTSGLLMVLFGLRALGTLRLPFVDRDARPGLARVKVAAGLGSAFFFGGAFALGWSPCIGPILASVLSFVATEGTSRLQGAAYLAVYAAGVSTPLIVVAAFAPSALQLLRRVRGRVRHLERATGALMLAVGVWMFWSARPWSSHPAPVAASASGAADAQLASSSCDAATNHICALPEVDAVSAEVHEIEGARMIEFVSDHCPICRRMAPLIADAERACDGFGARIQRVDVASAEGRALAARYHVLGTPTFVFISADGAESARIVGEERPEHLQAAIERAFALRCAASSPRPSHSG